MAEGTVRFADGSVYSLECFEERHGECPDDHGDDSEGNGSQDGYNCECSCSGADTLPAAPAPLAERAPEVTQLLARIWGVAEGESWPGGDTVSVLCEWFTANGYDIDAPITAGEAAGNG